MSGVPVVVYWFSPRVEGNEDTATEVFRKPHKALQAAESAMLCTGLLRIPVTRANRSRLRLGDGTLDSVVRVDTSTTLMGVALSCMAATITFLREQGRSIDGASLIAAEEMIRWQMTGAVLSRERARSLSRQVFVREKADEEAGRIVMHPRHAEWIVRFACDDYSAWAAARNALTYYLDMLDGEPRLCRAAQSGRVRLLAQGDGDLAARVRQQGSVDGRSGLGGQ